jgi:hypothetical protein
MSDAAPTSRRRLEQATARISRGVLRKASWNGASALAASLQASLEASCPMPAGLMRHGIR